MNIKPLIAATIAAITTVSAVLAIAFTVVSSTPPSSSGFGTFTAQSSYEDNTGITLAELAACDCAHSNSESWSK